MNELVAMVLNQISVFLQILEISHTIDAITKNAAMNVMRILMENPALRMMLESFAANLNELGAASSR